MHVGNFVEVKKSVLHEGVKAGHLTYLGDADIGAGTNVGAGTITCNYDGEKKHPTVIGEGAFIGSNTALVAPVTVGAGAYIGAGSTITKDVPPGKLGVSRARQVNLERRLVGKKKKSSGWRVAFSVLYLCSYLHEVPKQSLGKKMRSQAGAWEREEVRRAHATG